MHHNTSIIARRCTVSIADGARPLLTKEICNNLPLTNCLPLYLPMCTYLQSNAWHERSASLSDHSEAPT
eukprot:5730-Heterococcus_DN1.PRE.12